MPVSPRIYSYSSMNKHITCLVLVLCLLLPVKKTQAFVPRTPHLLHMVIQKIRQPAGLVVVQTRKIMGPSRIPDSRETAIEASTPYGEAGFEPLSLDEKLIYSPPDRMRAEVLTEGASRFTVESEAGFVKVSGGRTIAVEKSLLDSYTDVLLYRDYEILEQKMAAQGIDTQKVAFRRYGDRICYVVGRPREKTQAFPSLWVEKDGFFPVRYILTRQGRTVEFRYENWQKVSQTWYPMETDILLEGNLAEQIRVSRVDLASELSSSLFDVQGVEKQYPGIGTKGQDKNLYELDRQLEEFQKIYE